MKASQTPERRALGLTFAVWFTVKPARGLSGCLSKVNMLWWAFGTKFAESCEAELKLTARALDLLRLFKAKRILRASSSHVQMA